MRDDERGIRDLIATWQRATAAHDLPKIMSLMAEDVVSWFQVNHPCAEKKPSRPDFRKVVEQHRIESAAEIREIH